MFDCRLEGLWCGVKLTTELLLPIIQEWQSRLF